MPRLIDADKYLEKVCTYKETGCGSCKLQTVCPKDAPTVEAIPIEWIKKYIVDNTKVIDDMKYEVGANPVNYYIYPQQIAKMLTAWWEKENDN